MGSGLSNVKNKILLYHLTDINNLPSIIKYGLLPRIELPKFNISFSDIADPKIIGERRISHLDSYIPFHFHPYSAFDTVVKSSHPDKNFIYLCITREFARREGFLILPKHPLSRKEREQCTPLPYDEGFNNIDWDTMSKTNEQLKANSINEDYAKQVKMAECLANRCIKIEEFACIFTSEENKPTVQQMLTIPSSGSNSYHIYLPHIYVQNIWFQLNS